MSAPRASAGWRHCGWGSFRRRRLPRGLGPRGEVRRGAHSDSGVQKQQFGVECVDIRRSKRIDLTSHPALTLLSWGVGNVERSSVGLRSPAAEAISSSLELLKMLGAAIEGNRVGRQIGKAAWPKIPLIETRGWW